MLGGIVLGVLLDDGAIFFFELCGSRCNWEKTKGLEVFCVFYYFNHNKVFNGVCSFNKRYV